LRDVRFPAGTRHESPVLLYHRGAFFFQAEDGIRDFHVTGVQTCALPISLGAARREVLEQIGLQPSDSVHDDIDEQRAQRDNADRSEERRVGKECRGRWWPTEQKTDGLPAGARRHRSSRHAPGSEYTDTPL